MAFLFSTGASGNDRVNEFKRYLSEQPPIDSVVVSRQSLAPPRFGNPEGREVTVPVTHYQGSRSGGDFYIREVKAIDRASDVASAISVTGYNEREGAFYVSANALTSIQNPSSDTNSYPTDAGAESMRAFLSGILNFGILQFKRDTIKWDGNRFIAEREGFPPIAVELVISNDTPVRANVFMNGSLLQRCDYTYEDDSQFPKNVIVSDNRRQGVIPANRFFYHRFEVASHSLPEEKFAIKSLISSNIVYTNVLKGGAMYELGKNGELFRIANTAPGSTGPVRRHFGWQTAIFFVIAMLLLPLSLLLVKKRVQTSNNKITTKKHE